MKHRSPTALGAHRARIRRRALVTTLWVALGTACLLAVVAACAANLTSAGAQTLPATSSASPSPSPVSETLSTTVLTAVTVHRGQAARVRYRADDTAGGSLTVGLLVTTRDGTVRRRLVAGKVVQAGAEQVWRGRIRLRPGRYLLVARATDATGRRETSATPAGLRVLRSLPPLVPTARARRAAFAWASRRAGAVAVAVVDSRGNAYGFNARRSFITASTVKAMLLVAYLRRHRTVSDGMRATLTRMITVSDNASADAVYASVGRGGLKRLARLARMTSFRASAGLDPLPRRRRRHGAVLPGHGAVRPARPPQVRAQAALVHRPVPVVGHPGRGPAARLPRVLQGRLAGRLDARRARPRAWSATAYAWASPSSPTTTPPATTARRPSPASPPACSGADQADITPAPLSGGGHPPAPALRRRGRGVRCARRAVRGPRWPRSGRLRSRSRCRASSARSARAPRA